MPGEARLLLIVVIVFDDDMTWSDVYCTHITIMSACDPTRMRIVEKRENRAWQQKLDTNNNNDDDDDDDEEEFAVVLGVLSLSIRFLE